MPRSIQQRQVTTDSMQPPAVSNPPSATPLQAPRSRPGIRHGQVATNRTEPLIANNSLPAAPSQAPTPYSIERGQVVGRTPPPVINNPHSDVPSQASKRRRATRATVYVRYVFNISVINAAILIQYHFSRIEILIMRNTTSLER